MNEKMGEGLAHGKITTYNLIVVKSFDPWVRFGHGTRF